MPSAEHQANSQQRDYQAEYEQLTAKQQAIIQAHAEMPDAQNRKKAARAEDILGEDINTSYCSHVLNRDYPDIARYMAFKENEGEHLLDSDDLLRPPDDAIAVATTEAGIRIDIDRLYLRQLLEAGELPEPIHEAVVDAVLERAFDDDA